uniref:GTP_cyclohydro2 domain-containing protein n=1 Tax=Panagrellus redivivus TaxID=6233 RepID=A0A7E4VST4_PANRE
MMRSKWLNYTFCPTRQASLRSPSFSTLIFSQPVEFRKTATRPLKTSTVALNTNAATRPSYVDSKCDYATILTVVNGQDNDDDAVDVDEIIFEPIGPAQTSARQIITEVADACGYYRIGHALTRCTPGGHGCFHISQLFAAKDKVIASCIGRTEELIATRKKSFDRYHEALISQEQRCKVHRGLKDAAKLAGTY